MGIKTDIEWADSTLNLQMGCDGCELWNLKAGVKRCYAGTLHERYGGKNSGFAPSFDQPKLFTERLGPALKWSDLTGTDRPAKPWLNGLPRVIFLDDMGDTFTESLPLDWLAPLLPQIAESPHIFMLLTKRGSRMRKFSEAHPLPENVWPGVSVTSDRNLNRVDELWKVVGGGVKWISAEPLWGPVEFLSALPIYCTCGIFEDGSEWGPVYTKSDRTGGVGLIIAGGESGPRAVGCQLEWLESIVAQCKAAEVPCFVKQLGSQPMDRAYLYPIKDPKGGNPDEWPKGLNVRQFPEVKCHP